MNKKLLIILISLSLSLCVFFAYAFGFYGFVTTDSMEPTYPIGSFNFTNPFERDLEIGDVILFKCYNFSKCPKEYTWNIEHRLVKIEDGCYYFHGDNPLYVWDDPIRNPCLMRDEFVLLGVSHRLPLFDK